MTSTTPVVPSKLQELHADKKGAVMLTGLCMACFLIGSLWFIIGLGDAIVFRDTMQEVADHAAFTSAVVHARGMNFISACNLILLAMITIHIILGLIHDILLAFCILFAIPTLGAACEPYPTAMRIYHNYAKIMKPVAAVIHGLELVASYAYPYVGAVKGYGVGNSYDDMAVKKRNIKAIVISPSMMPGGVMDGALNAVLKRVNAKAGLRTDSNSPSTGRKGLPVEGQPYSAVCKKVGNLVMDLVGDLTGLGGILSKAGVWNMVKGWLGSALAFRYCNDLSGGSIDISAQQDKANGKIGEANKKIDDKNAGRGKDEKPIENINDIIKGSAGGGSKSCLKGDPMFDPGLDKWWGCEGPLVPWGGTQNGSAWNQVWAINYSPDFTDKWEKNTAIAKSPKEGKYARPSTAEESSYFATAEFYFDCKEEWGKLECNGSGNDNNAGFSVQWRARLRRLDFPNIGELLGTFAGQFASRLEVFKGFADKIKERVKGSDIGVGPLKLSKLSGAVDSIMKAVIFTPMQKVLRAAGVAVDNGLEQILGEGMFH